MRILCSIPNASTEISGVKFASAGGLMVSEDISEERAARFLSIEGFTEAPAIAPNVFRVQDQDDAGAQAQTSDVEPTSQEPADAKDEAETDDDDAGDDDDDDDTEDQDAAEDVDSDDTSKETTTAKAPARKSGAKKRKR